MRASGRLPLIDVLSTYNEAALNPAALGARMDRLGVALEVLSPELERGPWRAEPFSDWSESLRRLSAAQPARAAPAPVSGLDRVLYHGGDGAAFLDAVFARARAAGDPVLGEFRFGAPMNAPDWNNPKTGGTKEARIPLDGPLAEKLFAFSEKSGLPFLIVLEPEDAALPKLEALLARHPGAKVVWRRLGRVQDRARCRRYGPDYVRGLLDRFANLSFDLSFSGRGDYSPFSGTWTSLLWDRRTESLDDAWLKLIAARPERFMAGLGLDSDHFFAFGREVAAQRRLLQELPSGAREQAAYKSAWKLLTGRDYEPGGAAAAAAAAPAADAPVYDWAALKRGWRARVEAVKRTGAVPILDAASSFKELTLAPKAVAARMDALGVAASAAWPELEEEDPSSGYSAWPAALARVSSAAPSAFIPVATADNAFVLDRGLDSYAFLDRLFTEVRRGGYPMLGVFSAAEYPSPWLLSGAKVEWDVRGFALDGPVGERLFAFSEETGVPFQLHLEVEDRYLPALEAMLTKHPGAKVIWACAGRVRYPDRSTRYGADYVRALLDAHPNLYFNVSEDDVNQYYFPSGRYSSQLWDRRTGALDPKWAKLFAERPWRFLIALDRASNRWNDLEKPVAQARRLLDALPPDVREILAYKAAWKLLFEEDY